jgi:hypothetical protein
MGLDANEVGYFITQVGLAAASFGVTVEDVTAVGMALNQAFGYRCSPPVAVLPNATAELQAICVASDCPLSPEATCAAYNTSIPEPATATATATSNGTSSGTASAAPSVFTGGAMASVDSRMVGTLAIVLAGIPAFAFAL